MTHTPNEQLMQRILFELSAEPLSIHRLHQKTGHSQAEVRQALADLQHYGKVTPHYDGVRWERTSGGCA